MKKPVIVFLLFVLIVFLVILVVAKKDQKEFTKILKENPPHDSLIINDTVYNLKKAGK